MFVRKFAILGCAGFFLGNPSFSVSPAIAAGTCVPPPGGMIGWWRGEQNANDQLGLNNGILQPGATFAPGEVGASFVTSGSAVVSVPNSPTIDLSNGASWTIQTWAFSTSSSAPQHLAGKRSGCASGDGFYQLAIGGGAIPPGSLPLNEWAHVAVTGDGLTEVYRSYVNGKLVATNTAKGWQIQNSAPFTIGTSGSCAGFIGFLDEVVLYNRALSGEEIRSVYAARKSGMCLPNADVIGSVGGMAPTTGQIICTDLSTNQKVSINLTSTNTNWDCSAAGLTIGHGDKIHIGVTMSGPAQ